MRECVAKFICGTSNMNNINLVHSPGWVPFASGTVFEDSDRQGAERNPDQKTRQFLKVEPSSYKCYSYELESCVSKSSDSWQNNSYNICLAYSHFYYC